MTGLGEVTIWTVAVLACCGYLFLVAALVFTSFRQDGRVRVHEIGLPVVGAQRYAAPGLSDSAARPAVVAVPVSMARYRATAEPAGHDTSQLPRAASRAR